VPSGGSFGTSPAAPEPLPDRAPDAVCDIATLPQSALIYRLSGDWNPIHADPRSAEQAGLGRPILHGLCSMGIATRALLSTFAEGAPERLRAMFVRFSRPVFPGETIRTEFFGDGDRIRFRARVLERDVVVLDRATAVLA
jgi:acyl dehydratase